MPEQYIAIDCICAWSKVTSLSGEVHIRDLWQNRDLGKHGSSIAVGVPSHGAQLLHLRNS